MNVNLIAVYQKERNSTYTPIPTKEVYGNIDPSLPKISIKYDTVYNPSQIYHISFRWLVLSGPILNTFVTDITSQFNSTFTIDIHNKTTDITKYRIKLDKRYNSFVNVPITISKNNIYYNDIVPILEKRDYLIDSVNESTVSYISNCGCIYIIV